ncbi:hypothetical protein VNO80_21365 [Phaseolus coccineus]|uniref:Uncharacterized protein n=1 Tax=Phaseolus coccineus TaxID=3886 RepID=A0AAN9M2Z5_PHACN
MDGVGLEKKDGVQRKKREEEEEEQEWERELKVVGVGVGVGGLVGFELKLWVSPSLLLSVEGLKGYDDDDSFCFGCEGVDRWEVPDRLFNTRKGLTLSASLLVPLSVSPLVVTTITTFLHPCTVVVPAPPISKEILDIIHVPLSPDVLNLLSPKVEACVVVVSYSTRESREIMSLCETASSK